MKGEAILPIIAVFGAIVAITVIVGSSVIAQQYQSGGKIPSSSIPSASSVNMTNATAGGNMTGVGNTTNSSMKK